MSKHTPGPWNAFIWDASKPHEKTIGAPKKPGGADHVFTAELSEADARLIAAAPDLLDELKRANKIIMNALNLMTTEQQMAWGEKNERDGLIDDIGITRNHPRERVIAKAEGREGA